MRKSILVLGDIAIFYIALILTLIIRYGGEYGRNFSTHLWPFSAVFAIWVLVFFIANLYELTSVKNTLQFFTGYSYALIANVALAIAFFYMMPAIAIAPRRNLFIFIAIVIALDICWRLLYNRILVKTGYANNTLIVGLSGQSQELYDYLLANPQLGYNALGIIDVQNQAAAGTLEKVIREKEVKTLVIAREVYGIPHLIEILYRLVPLKLKFYNLPKFSERVTGKIPLSAIDQSWFLDNLSEGSRRGYELAKRLMDIVGAITIGIISIPFDIIIFFLIKFGPSGPLFIRQKREGRAGKEFTLYKFRSMITNAPDGSAEGVSGPKWAQGKDPRITKIGSFLRKTRLDELPQLWNVLAGNLSLVGPRPERPEFHDQLSREIPFYNERYLIKPGLMGWAQLKYKYGASVHDALEKLQYDLYYIKNRSILLDLSIILRTINIVLRQAGR